MAANLSRAARKVKLWAALLAFFTIPVAAQERLSYGPLIIQNAVLWTPHYLEMVHPGSQRSADILKAFQEIAHEVSRRAYSPEYYRREGSPFTHAKLKDHKLIQFRPGGHRDFNLHDGEPPRMAVTGNEPGDPVIFNLGRISDPRQFTYGDAIALWIHELGHKIKSKVPDLTQQEIDSWGAMIAKWYGKQGQLYETGGLTFFVLNPVPYTNEGTTFFEPFGGFPNRITSVFAAVEGDKLTDLSGLLEDALDSDPRRHPRYYETRRQLLNVSAAKSTGKEIELAFELRTSRHPVNLNQYLMSEIGINYHRSARVRFTRDWKSAALLSYVHEPLPRPLIMDAAAEIGALGVSTDKQRITGRIRIHLQNQTHFHAASYPTSHLTVLGLLDGEPVRLEADLRYVMTREIGFMPGEAYKKPFTKEASLSIDISHLSGKRLELTAIIDRFFTLGEGWTPPEEELKRVRLQDVIELELPQNCGEDLSVSK